MPRTIACRDEDFVDWHGGCTRAAVWAVEADTDGVRAAVAELRERWGDLLLPRYERQPHVTIAYRGPLPEPGATPMDEPYGPDRLAGDLAALRSLDLAPFQVSVGGWGTFPMVPYLRARAPELMAANRALVDEPRYTPHVTAGQYRVSVPFAEVEATAGGWEPPAVEPLRVERLTLMSYETRDVAGPLSVDGWLWLASGEWEPA